MTDYEPLSPVAVETNLRALVSDLTRAQRALAAARDLEVTAVHEYKSARRSAILAPDCPKVSRDGVTAAERDAYVEKAVEAEELAATISTAARESAQEHLRVVLTQASVVQSLARSVDGAYRLAGTS